MMRSTNKSIFSPIYFRHYLKYGLHLGRRCDAEVSARDCKCATGDNLHKFFLTAPTEVLSFFYQSQEVRLVQQAIHVPYKGGNPLAVARVDSLPNLFWNEN